MFGRSFAREESQKTAAVFEEKAVVLAVVVGISAPDIEHSRLIGSALSGVTSKPASWGHPKTSHLERDGRVIGTWW